MTLSSLRFLAFRAELCKKTEVNVHPVNRFGILDWRFWIDPAHKGRGMNQKHLSLILAAKIPNRQSKAEILDQELVGAALVASLHRLERLPCHHDPILR